MEANTKRVGVGPKAENNPVSHLANRIWAQAGMVERQRQTSEKGMGSRVQQFLKIKKSPASVAR
jgi:hypothetical protein